MAEDIRRNQQPGDPQPGKGTDALRLRESLLDLCYEVGFENIGLTDLLTRAGLTEEAFLSLYVDLEDCFCAVYLETRDDFLSRVERALADRSEWRDRMRATAYVLKDYLAEDARVTHLGAFDVLNAGERARLLFEEATTRLYDLIDEGRLEPGAGGNISRATAEAIGGSIMTQIYLAAARGEDFGTDRIPKLMYAVVLPYLGFEAAAEELRTPPPSLELVPGVKAPSDQLAP